MALLTLAEVSAQAPDIREIFDDDASYGTIVTPLLDAVEADYLTIRNRPWDSLDGEICYPAGASATALDMLRFRLASVVSIAIDSERSSLLGDSVSYTRDLIAGYPSAIVGRIKRYIGVH